MLQNFQTFQKHTFTDIFEIIYPSPPIFDNNVNVSMPSYYISLFVRALWLFILTGRISLYEETRYTLRISTIWKNIDKSVNYRKFYQSSLRKTFVYLDRHFHVILHYFEPWILNEYFELLTTQSPVFIESQLNVLVLRIWRVFHLNWNYFPFF